MGRPNDSLGNALKALGQGILLNEGARLGAAITGQPISINGRVDGNWQNIRVDPTRQSVHVVPGIERTIEANRNRQDPGPGAPFGAPRGGMLEGFRPNPQVDELMTAVATAMVTRDVRMMKAAVDLANTFPTNQNGRLTPEGYGVVEVGGVHAQMAYRLGVDTFSTPEELVVRASQTLSRDPRLRNFSLQPLQAQEVRAAVANQTAPAVAPEPAPGAAPAAPAPAQEPRSQVPAASVPVADAASMPTPEPAPVARTVAAPASTTLPTKNLGELSLAQIKHLQFALEQQGQTTGAKNSAHMSGGNAAPEKMDGLFQEKSNKALDAMVAKSGRSKEEVIGTLLSGDRTLVAQLNQSPARAGYEARKTALFAAAPATNTAGISTDEPATTRIAPEVLALARASLQDGNPPARENLAAAVPDVRTPETERGLG